MYNLSKVSVGEGHGSRLCMVYETATENGANLPNKTFAETQWEGKMVNVGIDLHKTQFTVCVRGRRGGDISRTML